jgi:tetratricopeptide (TPR) repeat protein
MVGDHDRAITILDDTMERVKALASVSPTALPYKLLLAQCSLALSDCYVRRRDWPQATRMAVEAIRYSTVQAPMRLVPQLEEARSRHRLGQISYATGHQQKAREEFNTSIDQLKAICSLRPDEPTCNRELLAVLAMCPIEDLRDPARQAAIATKFQADETDWFQLSSAMSHFRNGRHRRALEILGRRAASLSTDRIGDYLAAMAWYKLGEFDSARRAYELAEHHANDPNATQSAGVFGFCAVDFLRTEAGKLISEVGPPDTTNETSESRDPGVQDQPRTLPADGGTYDASFPRCPR